MEALSAVSEPDDELELVSVLLSERAEESDEVERRRDRSLREDPKEYLGSSVISFESVNEIGRDEVERRERRDFVSPLEGELRGVASDDGKERWDAEK